MFATLGLSSYAQVECKNLRVREIPYVPIGEEVAKHFLPQDRTWLERKFFARCVYVCTVVDDCARDSLR